MSPKPLEPSREALPPSIPYYVPAGALITTIVVAIVMAGVQNPEYPCSAINAMCAERERRERAPESTPASVLPTQRWGPSHALQMPDKPPPEWVRVTEGCPPDYEPMHGVCWVEIKERPPCATSYYINARCWAPLKRAERPGVSDGALR